MTRRQQRPAMGKHWQQFRKDFSDPFAADPAGSFGGLGADTCYSLGSKLRTQYGELLTEPLPEDFVTLLSRLDDRGGAATDDDSVRR